MEWPLAQQQQLLVHLNQFSLTCHTNFVRISQRKTYSEYEVPSILWGQLLEKRLIKQNNYNDDIVYYIFIYSQMYLVQNCYRI